MIARTMGVNKDTYEQSKEYNQSSAQVLPDRLRIDYDDARSELNPFPDSSLLDPLNVEQHYLIRVNVKDNWEVAEQNRLPFSY